MCWSESASIAATAVGAVATVYAAKKGVPKERTFALGYFTLMELLQAVSYIWIGQCDVGGNRLLTNLSFIHIAFQIPVANAFMLSFTSSKTRSKWFRPVMIVSFIASFLMLTKLIVPLVWSVPREWMCKAGDALCGTNSCSYLGNWHLAWRLPLLGFDPSNHIYMILVFILPVLYGSWRLSLFHFIFGPLLAFLLTTDHNESPAIWCLFSIAILCAIFFPPLKRWFETPMRSEDTTS
jgi:hypothetical protein